VTSVSFSTVSPPSSTTVGTPVAFTALATGGVNPQYQFLVRTPAGVWSTAQGYGSATFNWTTTGLAAGTYAIQVRARNAGSTASYEAVAQINYTLNSPVTSVTFSSVSPPTSTTVGTPVAFTALATGGVTPQYQFWLRTPAGVWSTAQGYGSATFNWTTTGWLREPTRFRFGRETPGRQHHMRL